MRYISVECEYFSAKFVPNPALLSELFLSEAMSIHSGGVDEQGKGQAFFHLTCHFLSQTPLAGRLESWFSTRQ